MIPDFSLFHNNTKLDKIVSKAVFSIGPQTERLRFLRQENEMTWTSYLRRPSYESAFFTSVPGRNTQAEKWDQNSGLLKCLQFAEEKKQNWRSALHWEESDICVGVHCNPLAKSMCRARLRKIEQRRDAAGSGNWMQVSQPEQHTQSSVSWFYVFLSGPAFDFFALRTVLTEKDLAGRG